MMPPPELFELELELVHCIFIPEKITLSIISKPSLHKSMYISLNNSWNSLSNLKLIFFFSEITIELLCLKIYALI